MIHLSFKSFLEQQEVKPNYFSSMKDNLGVDTSALKGVPNWLASASVGKITYNGIYYKISRFIYDDNQNVTGAMIKPLNVKGVMPANAFVKRDGKSLKVPNANVDTAERFVSIKDLNKIVTQGMDSAQAGGGAAAGGLPL
jgi:hypothetical protein